MNTRPLGTLFGALLFCGLLAGCGEDWTRLEQPFGVETLGSEPSLYEMSLTISGPAHSGGAGYGDMANLYLLDDAIGIHVGLPRHQPLRIPASAITGCSMSCTGARDRQMDLLIASTGSILSLPGNTRLIQWCWQQRRPIYPGHMRHHWTQIEAMPAPVADGPALASQDEYRAALRRHCRR